MRPAIEAVFLAFGFASATNIHLIHTGSCGDHAPSAQVICTDVSHNDCCVKRESSRAEFTSASCRGMAVGRESIDHCVAFDPNSMVCKGESALNGTRACLDCPSKRWNDKIRGASVYPYPPWPNMPSPAGITGYISSEGGGGKNHIVPRYEAGGVDSLGPVRGRKTKRPHSGGGTGNNPGNDPPGHDLGHHPEPSKHGHHPKRPKKGSPPNNRRSNQVGGSSGVEGRGYRGEGLSPLHGKKHRHKKHRHHRGHSGVDKNGNVKNQSKNHSHSGLPRARGLGEDGVPPREKRYFIDGGGNHGHNGLPLPADCKNYVEPDVMTLAGRHFAIGPKRGVPKNVTDAFYSLLERAPVRYDQIPLLLRGYEDHNLLGPKKISPGDGGK